MVLPKRILVIDPDVGGVVGCLEAFKAHSWDADYCETFLHALSLLEAHKYDIVIIEISLPEILGTEAWRIIQQINPGISGIITTNSKSLHRSIDPVGSGVFAYLLKPLDTEYVCALIKQMLRVRDITNPINQSQIILAGMYSLFTAITFTRTAEQIYEHVLAHLRAILQYDLALIYVQDSERGGLVRFGSQHHCPPVASLSQAQLAFVRELASESIQNILPKVVARSFSPVSEMNAKLESLDLESCIAMPFIGEKQVHGELVIVNKLLPEPSQNPIQVELISALAQFVAIALDRALANEKLAALELAPSQLTQA